MKKLVSFAQKTATLSLLAIALIGSIPPATLPDSNTPEITEPEKPDGSEEGDEGNTASPCSDLVEEEKHKN